MDRGQVTAVLEDVLDELKGLSPTELDRTLNSIPASTPQKRIEVVLAEQEEYRVHDVSKLMVSRGLCWTSIAPWMAAQQLVSRAQKTGAEAAVEWLERLLNTPTASCFYVMALWGVRTASRKLLTGNVELVPFEDLPESPEKERLRPRGALLGAASQFQPLWAQVEAPPCALVLRGLETPFLSDSPTLPPGPALDALRQLEEVRLCLTVTGTGSPLPGPHWLQFEDPSLGEYFGTGYSLPHLESVPHGMELHEIDGDRAERIVASFQSIGVTADRERILLSLGRLNQAKRRLKEGDRALDLAIALEILLGADAGEHTYKVALRAALVCGGDYQEKDRIRTLVEAVYQLRSRVAHEGQAPASVKIRGIRLQTSSVLADAPNTCADVIEKVLRRGGIPKWYALELGEQ